MVSKQSKFYLQEVNSDVVFILKNQNELIIKASSRNNPSVFYQNIIENASFPPPLKKKYTTLNNFFDEMTKSQQTLKMVLIFGEKQAVLSIKLSNMISYSIKLPLLQQNQIVNPKGKIISKSYESQQLKDLQSKQKQLDTIIKELQEQVAMLKLKETQKDNQFKQLETQKSNVKNQLVQANDKFEENKKKFVSNQIDFDAKYGQHVDQVTGKHRLFMRQKGVTDQMIKQIAVFDLRKIQVLSLGDNKITDVGFNLLFTDKKWPVLIELFLHNNKIENVHSLEKIPSLGTLALTQNELSQASCNYFCNHIFVEIKSLRLSFKKGKNNECWKKLIQKLATNFPKLKELYYSYQQDMSAMMKKKILDFCNEHHILLNHSLGGSGINLSGLLSLGGSGDSSSGGGNGLEELIKLKLIADLIKGAVQK